MQKTYASISVGTTNPVETLGSKLPTSIQKLINKIAIHFDTFPTVVPAACFINHPLKSITFFPLGESFKICLNQYFVESKKLSNKTFSTEREKEAKKERFELDYHMIKRVQLSFKSFKVAVNPYLTAVGKERLSCTFKETDSKKKFIKQIKSIIYLIEKTKEIYCRIIQLINLRIGVCNRTLKDIKDQYDPLSLIKINKIFTYKLEQPDFNSAREILVDCLPIANISSVQEPYQNPHGAYPDLPTFTQLTKIVPNVSAYLGRKKSAKRKKPLPITSVETKGSFGTTKVLKPSLSDL
jgi:hypothetical protein